MQSRENHALRHKMEETRVVCETEISIQQNRIDAAKAAFCNSLGSITAASHQTYQLQERLGKLKAELREMEDGLVKALAVKTRKEVKRMSMIESLSVIQTRIEELKGIIEDKRTKKYEYAVILSEQSEDLLACEDKYSQNVAHREDIEVAASWYDRVLGFRVECGHGVKFVFTNINSENPDEEYYFTIRHENELYSLLDCDPNLSDIKELINELNRSNGLFKFVRTMREKFQDAAAHGIYPQVEFHDQGTMMISSCAPISIESECEPPESQTEHLSDETNLQTIKLHPSKMGILGVGSPKSAQSVRRSPHIKAKK